jgi:hypothetical protein
MFVLLLPPPAAAAATTSSGAALGLFGHVKEAGFPILQDFPIMSTNFSKFIVMNAVQFKDRSKRWCT